MHTNIGQIGEDIACKYIQNKRYTVILRNYRKKYGEIDVIATNADNILCFFEVKTISRPKSEVYAERPEERVDGKKRKKLARTIMTYLHENRKATHPWNFYILSVYLDQKARTASVEMMEEILT